MPTMSVPVLEMFVSVEQSVESARMDNVSMMDLQQLLIALDVSS